MLPQEPERRRAPRIRQAREGSAEEAVELLGKMFFVMGIDPDNEESLAKGRDNFKFIESVRTTYENRKLWFERAIITALAALLVTLITKGAGLFTGGH